MHISVTNGKKYKQILIAVVISIMVLVAFPIESQAKLLNVMDKILREVASQQLGLSYQQIEMLQMQLKAQYSLENLTRDSFNTVSNELIGTYGYGKLLNAWNMAQNHHWSPNKLEELLNNLEQLKDLSSIAQEYARRNPTIPASEINAREDSLVVRAYEDTALLSRAGLSLSHASYNKIDNEVSTIEQLINEIDKSPNLKAAVDLNNRIDAQLALYTLEQWRLISMLNQSTANLSQQDVNLQTLAYKFINN